MALCQMIATCRTVPPAVAGGTDLFLRRLRDGEADARRGQYVLDGRARTFTRGERADELDHLAVAAVAHVFGNVVGRLVYFKSPAAPALERPLRARAAHDLSAGALAEDFVSLLDDARRRQY